MGHPTLRVALTKDAKYGSATIRDLRVFGPRVTEFRALNRLQIAPLRDPPDLRVMHTGGRAFVEPES